MEAPHALVQASVGEGKSLPPREHLDSIATKRVELYSYTPPEGIQVSILVTMAEVEGGILGKEKVAQAVRILKRGRSGGLLGMRAEDLKGWLREA